MERGACYFSFPYELFMLLSPYEQGGCSVRNFVVHRFLFVEQNSSVWEPYEEGGFHYPFFGRQKAELGHRTDFKSSLLPIASASCSLCFFCLFSPSKIFDRGNCDKLSSSGESCLGSRRDFFPGFLHLNCRFPRRWFVTMHERFSSAVF